jgi:hypothetical protein
MISDQLGAIILLEKLHSYVSRWYSCHSTCFRGAEVDVGRSIGAENEAASCIPHVGNAV